MLNRCSHHGTGIPVGCGQNAVVVLERLGAPNALDDLEVRLAFEEALPDRTCEALPLCGGEAINERLEQLAAVRAAYAERVGENG
ncbi:hypothetical protein D3C87_1638020 [compost metagenome]